MNTAQHPALAEIAHLFDTHGHLTYGEGVTQLQHALQCATLAAQAHVSDGLVLATFLHDIGHMQHPDAAGDLEQGRDDTHEALGADFLARWFGPDVSEPVRLHVQAKRYLCQGSPDYLNQLSPTSVRTLRLQGGPMTPQEALAFEQHPYRDDALRLRRWDDSGKEAHMDTLPMAHFMQMAEQHLLNLRA